MDAPLLTTKLNIPSLRPQRVRRTRLIERLNSGLWGGSIFNRKLTFLSAPAGYGKTTLVTEWLNQLSTLDAELEIEGAVAWLSLDENDNDPVRFISYVIAAIQRLHPDFGESTHSILKSPQPPGDVILTTLLNEMAAISKPYLLVLDDYHSINLPAIHQQLGILIERLPDRVHLVLVSREDPLLPLARIRAGGQMLEIRGDDLRFSTQECASFIQDVMEIQLSNNDISALERRTEGWIAGLQLAALSMHGLDDPASFVKAFTGSSRFVLDYLVEEVYRRQPGSIQDFLKKTAVLDRLSAPLCDAVAGISGSQEILESLEHANLFIIPLDQTRTWYRYHRLFGELLRHRLRGTSAIDPADLHDRASVWFERNNLVADAVQHAINAENWERVASLIHSVNTEILSRGETATLIRWFNQIPTDVLYSNPVLCFEYSWPLLLTGQLDKAAPLLDHIEGLGIDAPEFMGEVMAAQAYLARAQEDHPRMVERSQRALALLPKTSVSSRGLVAINLGLAYWHIGLMEAAEEALGEACGASQASGNHFASITALIFQGRVHAVRGQLSKAEAIFRKAIEEGGQIPINALAHLDLSVLHYEWNNLSESEDHLKAAIDLSQRGRNDEFLVACWLFSSRLYLGMGDPDSAGEALSKAKSRIQVGDIPLGTSARLGAAQVLLHLAQDDPDSALKWSDQLSVQVDPHPMYRFLGLVKARLLIAQNAHKAARRYLEEAYQTALQGGWGYGLVATRVWQSIAAEDSETAVDYLSDALQRAETEGFIRTYLEAGQGLIPLLSEAARRGIEPGYAGKILSILTAKGETPHEADQSTLVEPLSKRELEVLRLVTAGLSNRQIAEKLFVSPGTAKTHVHNICAKLGVKNRTGAASRAKELGLV